jgi:hypothetical protein
MGPQISPLPVMGVVRRGVRLYAENARGIWRVLVPLAVATQFVGFLVTLAAAPAGSTVINGITYAPPGSSVNGIVLARLVSLVLTALASVLGAGVAVRMFSEAAFGRPEEASDALRFALQRFGALLWVSIVFFVALTAGFFVFLLPGIWLVGALAVALPVFVVEDRRGFAALHRSRELVKRRWWATFGALFPLALVVGLGSLLLELALNVNGSVTSHALSQAVAGVAIQALLAPVGLATAVAVYIDLRARKEHLQIDSTALRSDLTITPTPPPATDSGWFS